MKKRASVFLCFLLLLSVFYGCQKAPPQSDALPFETYGEYKILNVTTPCLCDNGVSSKPNFYDEMRTIDFRFPAALKFSAPFHFGGKELPLRHIETRYDKQRKEFWFVCSFTGDGVKAGAEACFTDDGELIRVKNPPVELRLSELWEMDDQTLRLTLEDAFSELFDFSEHTEFSVRRDDHYGEKIEVEWSRSYQGYTVDDEIRFSMYSDELLWISRSAQIDIKEGLTLPTREELDPVLEVYLTDYFRGTGKSLVSFDWQYAYLTRFGDEYALRLHLTTEISRTGEPDDGFVDLLILFE